MFSGRVRPFSGRVRLSRTRVLCGVRLIPDRCSLRQVRHFPDRPEYRHLAHIGMQSFAALNVAIIAQLRGGSPKFGEWAINSGAGHYWLVRRRNRAGRRRRWRPAAGAVQRDAELPPAIARRKSANRGSASAGKRRRAGKRERRGGAVSAGRGHGCRGRSVRSAQCRTAPDRCRSGPVNRALPVRPALRRFAPRQLPGGGRARCVFDSPFSRGKSVRASVQRPSCAIA
jgi:hypothetical protein